eukprot:CAMPEP_0176041396 /NCGR_PEP_ID=MMETSP0120_2-20121206/20532_1 /TAXON_ID=160619 /ORGANISM="Kryptoperidinium foliaceum, Strain CCMP 1326" /LENGTH=260 /DNA_ID=CAMNT_0017374797 /DNA_START=44 /DNA_END=826 /DNA_ORIENTATION=+
MKLSCAIASALALGSTGVDAISAKGSAGSCDAMELDHRSSVLNKLKTLDVECEEMCKKLGAYPDGCQCPGFAGNPSSDGDARKCAEQYCQDPKTPCPNDGFVTCVDESTKIAALQWQTVSAQVDRSLAAFTQMTKAVRAKAAETACGEASQRSRMQVRDRLRAMDVECEEMCKKLGAYPDGCQCPGFAGNPSSDGDTRKCAEQYCHDPKTPCPNDGFVTCVDEATKIAALQWKTLFQRLDKSLTGFKSTFSSVVRSERKS